MSFKLAGVLGIEPRISGSKPEALPLGDTPTTKPSKGGNYQVRLKTCRFLID